MVTDLVPYVEVFAWDDQHPAGHCGFVCSVDGRPVDVEPCPDHAPRNVPGLRLVGCEAIPRHLIWVHDREDYGVPCFMCQLEERYRQDAEARQCRHWPWRRWRLWRRIVGVMYQLGIISGSTTMAGDLHNWCTYRLCWRGIRPYILGVDRNTWQSWRGRLGP